MTASNLSASLTRVRHDRRALLAAAVGLALTPRLGSADSDPNATRSGLWVEATNVGLARSARANGAPDPVRFATPWPIHAAAAFWSSKEPVGATLRVEFSVDGNTWSAPVTIGEDPDQGRPAARGRRHSSLVMTNGARYLRYQGFNTKGETSPLLGLTWVYIDPAAGPAAPVPSAVASDRLSATTRPAIVSREAWGADERLRFQNNWEIWPVERAPVTHFVLHHSSTLGAADPALTMRALYYHHAVIKGWGDLGYNYLIDGNGLIYEGRAGGEGAAGAHTSGYNLGSCGVGLLGDGMTPEVHDSLTTLAAWATRGVDPNARLPLGALDAAPVICGHQDLNQCACPGPVFTNDLATLRASIAQYASGGAPSAPVAETEATDAPLAAGFVVGDQVTPVDDGLTLRDGPGLAAARLQTLDRNQRLVVASAPQNADGMIWYQVSGNDFDGWAAAPYLRQLVVSDAVDAPAVGGMESASDIAGPAAPDWSAGETVAAAGDLNVRSTPGGEIVLMVNDGAWLTVTGDAELVDNLPWYPVDTGTGVTGWVAGEYLAKP